MELCNQMGLVSPQINLKTQAFFLQHQLTNSSHFSGELDKWISGITFNLLNVRLSVVRGFSLSFVFTFFQFLNLPIYWPLLVLYFLMLMFVLLKQRIQHMLKYRYIPMDIGKKTFKQQRGGGVKFSESENPMMYQQQSAKGVVGSGRQFLEGHNAQLV